MNPNDPFDDDDSLGWLGKLIGAAAVCLLLAFLYQLFGKILISLLL